MKRQLAMALPLCLSMGCATTEASSGPPAGPGAPAAAPSSGGTTLESAEPVSRGQTVEGVVIDSTPRYYVIELSAAETLQLGFYTQVDKGTANATLAVLDPMGGKLKEQMVTVGSTGDWDVNQIKYTVQGAGKHLIRAACYKCLDKTVRYRIAVQ
ncbi:MAG TPA: hypothetical protein VKN99_10605 [Polyangia bacterium]|nr:hypothetical protein [Polyangia bacterium]